VVGTDERATALEVWALVLQRLDEADELALVGRLLVIARDERPAKEGQGSLCHTLKYSILGCDYLLQCVHLSIGFSENFKDFSGNYSIYPRARSIFFYLESSKILFYESQIFYRNPRDPNYLPSFLENFWHSSRYIFLGLKYLSGLF
jgi:hypothetical protein